MLRNVRPNRRKDLEKLGEILDASQSKIAAAFVPESMGSDHHGLWRR